MLLRFDPFRDLDRLVQPPWAWGRNRPSIPMDAYRQGDRFVVHFDLPGIDPASIDLTVEKNVLTVSAERKGWDAQNGQDKDVLVSERVYGRSAASCSSARRWTPTTSRPTTSTACSP